MSLGQWVAICLWLSSGITVAMIALLAIALVDKHRAGWRRRQGSDPAKPIRMR